MEDKFNIINCLKSNLKSIFSLNENIDTNLIKCFKVLIFDDAVFQVLSPLLKVYSLREENICLHLNIKTKKEKMPNVMAIYLVEPSQENYKLIENDLKQKVFDNYYFVFTNTFYENEMNNFFSLIYNTGCSDRVYKIECYPMGLMTYHSKIFSLDMPSPYFKLNSPNIKDDDIQNYLRKVGNGIFNLIFTLNSIPVIKCRTGWFAEHILKEIQTVFDYNFEKYPSIKSRIQSKNETLLVLLDRESDLPIMFHHPYSLGGMMQDLFGVNPTKTSKSDNDKLDSKNKDLPPLQVDPVEDSIWNNYVSSSYIDTVEQIIKDEIKKISDETKFLDDNPSNLINNMSGKSENDISKLSEKMSATLDNIKDIQMKKNILNNYAKYHSQLYAEVNKRHLGQFYMLEEELLTKRNSNNDDLRKQFFEILRQEKFKIDSENKNFRLDVLRLAIIFFLVNPEIKPDDYKMIEDFLTGLKVDLSALSYLKSKKDFIKSMNVGGTGTGNSGTGGSTVLKKGFSYLFNRIGGIMTEPQPSVVSDILYSLSSGKEVNNYFEYSLLTKDKVNSKGASFTKVIVFICGGGSLVEFESVDSFLSKKGKQVS